MTRLAAGVVRRLPSAGRLLVALSGGRDSVVLLHMVRFGGVDPERLVAAHLDHGMRSCSGADADWVRGLCRAWGVTLVEARLSEAPRSEAEARARRWEFLECVSQAAGAVGVVTAHHADDQAETVLHHLARGTGLRGLAGMRVAAGGRLRPLLPVPGEALADHARRWGLAWRQDPSNADEALTRNRLRHRVLPALEAAVPDARRALCRVSRLARREEEALAEAASIILEGVVREVAGGRLVLDRDALLEPGPALRARLLRAAVRRVGGRLDAIGTRYALAFTSRAGSGREVHLTGGMRLSRELDAFVLAAPGCVNPSTTEGASGEAIEVEVGPGARGTAPLRLATGAASLNWGPSPDDGSVDPRWLASLELERLRGPLRLRSWAPGDRIRMPYGTKKLKKLLAEARLDRERRRDHPVVEDGTGRIVWVPGISDAVSPALRGTTFHIWIRHDAGP